MPGGFHPATISARADGGAAVARPHWPPWEDWNEM